MGEYKNKSIKKRLDKLHKELTTPHADCLVAEKKDGVVEWMGVEYKTQAALDKAIKFYGVTSEKPLVIIPMKTANRTFDENTEQSLTKHTDIDKD